MKLSILKKMPTTNPTIHNWIDNSISFNSTETITLPQGVDTTVQFAHRTTFPTAFNFSAFAVHAWIKPSATTSIRSRVIQTNARTVGGVTNAFMVGLLGDTTFFGGTAHNALRVGMSVDPDGTQVNRVTSEPVLRPDTWHHILCQRTDGAGAIEIYVDGCQQDLVAHADIDYSSTTNTGGTTPSGIVVGWDPNLDGPFKGNIASLALFNRALTGDEIRTLAMGPTNILNSTSGLTVNCAAWWKMGDDDATGLGILLDDTTNQYNLTSVNLAEGQRTTDVPKEHPPIHKDTHVSTGCDKLPVDPGTVICPIIWDSFARGNDQSVAPLGWFPNPTAGDDFDRVAVVGRTSVLRFNHAAAARPQFLTNYDVAGVGGTLLFGNPLHPDPTEYCMEFVARSVTTADDIHYFGFVENPHTVGNAIPGTGVFMQWVGDTRVVSLVVADGTSVAVASSGGALVNNQFYRFKLCFSYIPDLVAASALRARLWIDNVLVATNTVLSTAAEFPAGEGDVYLGTTSPSGGGAYDLDLEWVSVTHRGIGSDDVLGV